MAFTAATPQATVETCRQNIVKAEKALDAYLQINNPTLLAQADAALTALATSITAVKA